MSNKDFLIVGLGASAGGIAACREFFTHVPSDTGIAYVVILHLSPAHESQLAEVLQTSAAIPVIQVRERTIVEPDHVYVIPPNQTLSIRDGHLELLAMTGSEQRRSPVDTFFRTLAEAHGPRAGCVVLSGTGANGSLGLKHVKAQGGICLVQDPDQAAYADMPQHAIATGAADAVLPVADIPGKLLAYNKTLDLVGAPPPAPAAAQDANERALREIFTLLRSRTGHDFSGYKRPAVLRRIGRRMALHELQDLLAYAAVLRDRPEESQALFKDLLISVTSFFRDPAAFDTLERIVIPKLFEHKTADDEVRVWIPGCATGEEAYSIAILLAEHIARVPGSGRPQLFATDIDERAIAIARDGLYSESAVADVSPERLARFFFKEGEGYRIRKDLRDWMLFATHSLLKDPPFAHLDLVSCRNLLIYLDRPAQVRAAEILHFALRPDGYLFLGASESVEGGNLFVSIDRDAHIYRSRAVGTRVALPLPDRHALKPTDWPDVAARRLSEGRTRERASFADLHHRLLEEYAAPSVVVNEAHDIVHLTERAGRFLQFTAGEPSRNLLHAIRPELRLELRTALYQAAQDRTPVQSEALPVRIDDRPMTVRLMVRPVLREEDPARGFFLVLFDELRETVIAGDDHVAASTLTSDDTTRQLEAELVRVNNQLRVNVEQYEVQTEELKASNQELQATNEELRSSTEELETSREELQSGNEELRTVNQELKNRLEELSEANNDIQNLINSSEIGTLFLDRSFRIKLCTPTVRSIFTVIPSDRGRALSDISSKLIDVDLRAALAPVLDRLERIEREVTTQDQRAWLMHAVPYRTTEDRIDGIIVTFVDITERKLAEERLRQSQIRLRLMIESAVDYAIFSTDLEGRIGFWNSGAMQVFGYTDAEAVGRSAEMLFTPEDRARGVPADEMRQAQEHGRATDERWHVRKDGSHFFGSGTQTALRDESGALMGYLHITRDLTERKQSEDALRHAHDDLERLVADRTQDLEAANHALDVELQQRRATEERTKRLLARLISVQEEERRRIARDLHDHLGQQMTALRLKVESVLSSVESASEAARRVEAAQTLIARLDAQLDFLTWELRPDVLDHLGLVAALRNFVSEWSTTYGIPAEFHSTSVDHERFGFEVETNLYRIAQEALNNVYKHADATRVRVVLERRRDDVALVVEDDGEGFTDIETDERGHREHGFGVVSMQERAALLGGRLDIRTAPGEGTSVIVQLPVSPQSTQ